MSKVYLLNVGANSADSNRARSPVFVDESNAFEFVPFSDSGCTSLYPKHLHKFVRTPATLCTHIDPDWANLTYGDNCANGRAGALLQVLPGDILLFWALFWRVPDRKSDVFATNDRGWYLVGSLRVTDFLTAGESLNRLSAGDRKRASANAHVWDGHVDGEPKRNVRVFLGDPRHSRRFDSAVDLGVHDDRGLLRRSIRTKAGQKLEWNKSPRWNSALRACRAVLDLDDQEPRVRANLIRDAIEKSNPRFDLLSGL